MTKRQLSTKKQLVTDILMQTAKKYTEETGISCNPQIVDNNTIVLTHGELNLNVDFNLLVNKLEQQEDLEGFLMKLFAETPATSVDFYKINFAIAKPLIFPLIRAKMELPEEDKLKEPLICEDAPVSDLKIYYIIDNGETMMFITNDFLDSWGVSEKDIKRQALTNLEYLHRRTGLHLSQQKGLKFYTSNTFDGFDATRLLVLDYKKLKKKVNGEVIIGIPNRDSLVVFGSEDPFLHSFALSTFQQYKGNRYALSPLLYLWNGKEFLEISPK